MEVKLCELVLLVEAAPGQPCNHLLPTQQQDVATTEDVAEVYAYHAVKIVFSPPPSNFEIYIFFIPSTLKT